MIGQSIGHYTVLERIGGGGMGIVYRAEDTRLRRRVALKFLPPELCSDSEARARLVEEARAASALDHPNICTIHAIEEPVPGQVFIVMPEYTGETLAARVGGGPLRVEDAIGIAEQMAEGLARAHEAGLVHRDVKPANVMLTSAGIVKILDFGLALVSDSTIQAGTSTWGTLSYMSPEQAGGEPVDAATDMWAMGVVLYEMLTGITPFRADTPQATVAAVLRAAPRPLAELRRDVPADVAAIVSHALARERADRYPSMKEILADLRAARSRLQSGSGAARAVRRMPSIAVLPFSDMSPARDQDYFCEGIAEELINALASLENVRIAARTSSFQFKGQAADVRAIGEKLDVQTVLEGSVRKAGDRFRITAQLIDVASGYHLWSERYDRTMDDVFAVQDEIAGAILEKLKVKLAGDEQEKRLVKRHTVVPEAYENYLQGRYYWSRRHEGAFQKAIDCFEEAVAIDPDYALAHAGLADAYTILGLYGFAPPLAVVKKARPAAERAVSLAPELAEAHAALGLARVFLEFDLEGGRAEYERALTLNPDAALSRGQYASVLAYLGRFDEALAHSERAVRTEPASLVVGFYLSATYLMMGRPSDAVAEADRVLSLEPDFPLGLWVKGAALHEAGRSSEAVGVIEKAARLLSGSGFSQGVLGRIYGQTGRRTEALEIAKGLERRAALSYVAPLTISDVYVGLQDWDRALACLERAYENRDGFLVRIGVDQALRPLHGDPRFEALRDRLGLPRFACPVVTV